LIDMTLLIEPQPQFDEAPEPEPEPATREAEYDPGVVVLHPQRR
jgi:hypothetical protein